MSVHQALFATYENLLGCDSADFDASTDYLTRDADLTGAADGKQGTVMFWFRLDGGDGTNMTIFTNATTLAGATSRWRVRKLVGNGIDILGLNAAGTTILDISTSATYTAGATWYQFLASWNLATAAAHLYVNDVDVLTSTTLTDDSIDYTVADWAIGGQASGGTLFDGALAEVYLALEYIDLSVLANRRKFISFTGKPIALGNTGQFPTGTAAIVYQHLDNGEAVANFGVNAGTGGGFTVNGTLATGSTSPSD